MSEQAGPNMSCRQFHPEWVAPNGACGQCRQFGWNAEREKLLRERDEAFAAGARAMRIEAAKAVCLLCRDGYPVVDYPPDPKIKGSGPLSIHTLILSKEPCPASGIRALPDPEP